MLAVRFMTFVFFFISLSRRGRKGVREGEIGS